MRERGRIRRPAYEEQHKFRPTSRGTNVYVGSTKSWKSGLVEVPFDRKTVTPENRLAKKILSGGEFVGLEALVYLGPRGRDNENARKLMLLFLERSDMPSLVIFVSDSKSELPLRLKAVELLSNDCR